MSSAPKTPPAAPSPAESAPDDSFVLTLPDDPASDKDWYLWAGVLALLVFVAFFPAVTGQYLWDDDRHAGLIQYFSNLAGLKKIWTPQAATPQYYPLTFTTFWIEYYFWADSTLGYHIDNMILHAASAVLVWRLLRRLKLPGAWLAAAIWAVHPLQTESVAWISERKNVLSGLLFFASIWFYFDYDAALSPGKKPTINNKPAAYAISLVLFALALLAKTVACVMPATILILAWWRGRKVFDRKTILPLLPYLGAGLLLGAFTVYLEAAPTGNVGAHGPDWDLSFVQRLLIAGRGLWFYVGKILLPITLTFSYPRVLPTPAHFLYLAAAIGALALLWIKRNDWGRGPLAAVLFYIVALFPSLGFINIYPMRYSFVADHFQYLAGLGLIVLFVGIGAKLLERLRLPMGATAGIGVAIVVALFCPAWLQAHIYESRELLWTDVLAKNPGSWMADDNFGVELINLGEQKENEAASDRAQEMPDPANDADAESKADFKKAEDLLHNAIALRPQSYATHNALGLLYRHLNRWTEAESELQQAVAMQEQDELTHRQIAPYINYAQVFKNNHPDADVRPWLEKAIALSTIPHTKPTDIAMARLAYGDYWINRASADAKAKKLDDERNDLKQAIEHLNAAVASMPDDIAGLFNLGQAYERLGLLDQESADAERTAGQTEKAAQDEYISHQVDDPMAMKNYMAAIGHVQSGRFAAALAGVGKIYRRNVLVRDTQVDAVRDLLTSLQCFKDALSIDPTVPDAAHYLPDLSAQLLEQGREAREHGATWEPLRQKLQILADGNVTKQTVADVEQAAHAALWPASATHPLRGPLTNVRVAIGGFQMPIPPKDADKTVADAARMALSKWNARNPQMDTLDDALAATMCYAGAAEADDHATGALKIVKELSDSLAGASAAHPDRAKDIDKALAIAHSVLTPKPATTQSAAGAFVGPTTSPTTNP
jgi:tetratricopeptide (TPR) repeat protein